MLSHSTAQTYNGCKKSLQLSLYQHAPITLKMRVFNHVMQSFWSVPRVEVWSWSNGSQAREKIRNECFRSCSILSECHMNLIAKCRTHPFQKSVNIATRITFPRLKFKQLITKKKHLNCQAIPRNFHRSFHVQRISTWRIPVPFSPESCARQNGKNQYDHKA